MSMRTMLLHHRGWLRYWSPSYIRPMGLLPLAVLLSVVLLVVAEALNVSTRSPTMQLNFGSRESSFLLDGFYSVERHNGKIFRWSSGEGRITFPQVGRGATMAFSLRV